MTERQPETAVRSYYRTIDDGDYAGLADLLAPEFVQVRGDRTLEGREAFVGFMRDERPDPDTTHEVDAVHRRVDGGAGDPDEVAVRGRLRRADGSVWFGFVDVFAVEGGRLSRLVTYMNDRVD